jgi:hypothetical protein
MNPLLPLIGTLVIAALMELILWTMFRRSVSPVHFVKPVAPSFFHISSPMRMALLALVHFAFTSIVICIAYLFLW